MAEEKDVEIKARVTTTMRDQMQAIADKKNEKRSVFVREAIAEYLIKHAAEIPESAESKKKSAQK